MDMHERLTKKALEPILRKLRLDGIDRDGIATHLANEAIIVPHPGYGQIVYDVPAEYTFPILKDRMDAEQAVYEAFFQDNLAEFYFHKNLNDVPDDGLLTSELFFWNNGYFPRGDARSLYAIISSFTPKLFLEIGVGNSTRIARKAIQDFNLSTKIKSIDPAPRADITAYSDEVINESVTDSSLATFRELVAGDILFIDGSHVCQVGTDVPFFFLNVFPILAEGVIVHIHDVFLPWEYYEAMRIRHYNEHHMLGAMLMNSLSWEILFPVHYANQTKIIPNGGGSFWFKKGCSG